MVINEMKYAGKAEAEARDNAGKARAVCQVRMPGRQWLGRPQVSDGSGPGKNAGKAMAGTAPGK